MLLPYEKGLGSMSEIFEVTPSDRAAKLLYFLQRAGYFYCDSDYSIEHTGQDGYLLFYMVKGKMYVSAHGEKATVCAGECGFISCNGVHSYGAVESLEYMWIYFNGANTKAFWKEIRKEHGLIIPAEHSAYIRDQMQQIFYQLRVAGHIEETAASRMLYDMICNMLDDETSDRAGDPLIASVQEYLELHFSEDVSTAALAKQFHLSVSQFNRKFREGTGQSPHEYLVNLRINRAKRLLKETKLSVTEIAGAVGYAYDTSFAAAFRSKVGMSPRQFRNLPS